MKKYPDHGTVQFNAIKWLFVGPPRVGKTATKYHLLGDWANMLNPIKSTGLESPTEISYINSDTYIDSEAVAFINTEDGTPVSGTWSKLSLEDLAHHLICHLESLKPRAKKSGTSGLSHAYGDGHKHEVKHDGHKHHNVHALEEGIPVREPVPKLERPAIGDTIITFMRESLPKHKEVLAEH